MIGVALISKALDDVFFSLVSEEKICSGTEDDSISINRELVKSSLVCENKIFFSWDDSPADIVSCLLSRDATILKSSDDRITPLIEDDVEGVDLRVGISICWISLVAFHDVISSKDDDFTTGCDALISAGVKVFSFGKRSSTGVSE